VGFNHLNYNRRRSKPLFIYPTSTRFDSLYKGGEEAAEQRCVLVVKYTEEYAHLNMGVFTKKPLPKMPQQVNPLSQRKNKHVCNQKAQTHRLTAKAYNSLSQFHTKRYKQW